MKPRGLLAVATAIALASWEVRAGEPTAACVIDSSSITTVDSVRGTLRLRGEETPGYWISDAAMHRAAVRMTTCIDGWTQCQVDLATSKGKITPPSWKTWVYSTLAIGALGFGTGYVVGRVK